MIKKYEYMNDNRVAEKRKVLFGVVKTITLWICMKKL